MKRARAYMVKYEDRFDDMFPSFCFMHLSPDEMVEVIKQCLEAGKDVYEMGFLTDDNNVKY